ncbi:MAG: 4'-phosphopantetheinyl transferase family protein [Myxococcota bacterium]
MATLPSPDLSRRVEELSARLGAEVWAQPIEKELSSPSDDENMTAASLGPLRGPHFTAGRLAARASLSSYGVHPHTLPREGSGAVGWPPGFVGAIAHTPALAVAVTAPTTRFYGVGIDVERADRCLSPGARRLVARPEEAAWLEAPAWPLLDPLMLLVAAKEVVFKAYFPHTQVRLRYHDARLEPFGDGLRATVLRQDLALPLQMDVAIYPYGDYLVLGGVIVR